MNGSPPTPPLITNFKQLVLSSAGLILSLGIWQLIFSFELLNRTLLPSPSAAFERLWQIVITGNVLPDLWITLARMMVGYVLAALLGVLIGLAMGSSQFLYQGLSPLIDAVRSTPVTACYPVFVLLAGVNHASKSLMVFAAALPIIVLNTAYGVRQASPIRAQMARLFGANTMQVFLHITIWDAALQTWIGLRTSFSLALVVEIVAEMFAGTKYGIGQRLFEAFNTYSTDELYALIILIGIIGYVLNLAFVVTERRLLHWTAK